MTEYIKRDDVIEAIASGDPTDGWENIFCGRALIGMITKIPAADVVERKRGEWKLRPDPYGWFETIPVCSICGCTTKWRETYMFCPNCGADMRQEEGDG